MAYNTPGNYQSGLWMISKGGTAYVVDKTHLPATNTGWRYYWLGNGQHSPHDLPIVNVLAQAADDLGTSIPQQSGDSGPQASNKLANQVAGYWSGQTPVVLKLPKQTAGDVIAEIFGSPAAGILGIPAAGAVSGAGEAGAGEAAGSKAGSAGAAANAANAAKTIVGGLTVASLFTNTSLWAGVGMTLLGAFLVLFGIIKLSGADPKAVAKRVMP